MILPEGKGFQDLDKEFKEKLAAIQVRSALNREIRV